MSTGKTHTSLRIDKQLYAEIERLAAMGDRSIHGQILHMLKSQVEVLKKKSGKDDTTMAL